MMVKTESQQLIKVHRMNVCSILNYKWDICITPFPRLRDQIRRGGKDSKKVGEEQSKQCLRSVCVCVCDQNTIHGILRS